MSETDWKQHHANEADKVIEHALVQGVMAEFADNMGFALFGLPAYGLAKIAHHAAMVARAQALGFDPELLRLSSDEATSEQLRLAADAALLGVPVHLLGDGSTGGSR